MKKKLMMIPISILSALCITSCGTNSDNTVDYVKVISNYEISSNGSEELKNKVTESYDKKDNLVKEKRDYYNYSGEMNYSLSYVHEYNYKNDLMMTDTLYKYNDNNKLYLYTKDEYIYQSNMNTETKHYCLTSGMASSQNLYLGTVCNYEYDSHDNLIYVETNNYDESGNISYTEKEKHDYEYSGVNAISVENKTYSYDRYYITDRTDWTYDTNGNIVCELITKYNDISDLTKTSKSKYEYTYDTEGNVIAKNYSGYSNDTFVSGENTKYEYNSIGTLKSAEVTTINTAGSNISNVINYTYDENNYLQKIEYKTDYNSSYARRIISYEYDENYNLVLYSDINYANAGVIAYGTKVVTKYK